MINVKDLGAYGDGRHDDTRAIQVALMAAEAQREWVFPETEAEALGSRPTVFFPAGKYLINGSLSLPEYVLLQGGSNSILVQGGPGPSIVARAHVMIDNLAFYGGATAIYHSTSNSVYATVDTRVIIQKCEFHWTSDYAIFTEYSNSTVLTIKDCKFLSCEKVLRNTCNIVNFERCYVKTPDRTLRPDGTVRTEGMREAAFENFGALYMREVFGATNGSPAPDAEPRWVDNHGSLYLLHCDLASHGGPGLTTFIKNYACAIQEHVVLSLVNSSFSGVRRMQVWVPGQPQPTPRPGAAIHLVQLPNVIEIRGNRGFYDMKLLHVDSALDLSRLNRDFQYEDLRISISDNVGANDLNTIERVPQPIFNPVAVQPYEHLITFLNPELVRVAESHSDDAPAMWSDPTPAFSPAGAFAPGAWIGNDIEFDPPGNPRPVAGPRGRQAARVRPLGLSLGGGLAESTALNGLAGQPGVYTLSALVRTHRARVNLTAFNKRITAYKFSPLWSRLSGSFFFDGRPLQDISIGFGFAFDDQSNDPNKSFVDICAVSLTRGPIPSP